METAREMYDRLRELGHNYSPEKQAYKATIAGKMVTLYDPNSADRAGQTAAVSVRAEYLEEYVGKGFLFEPRPIGGERDETQVIAPPPGEGTAKTEAKAPRGKTKAAAPTGDPASTEGDA